MYAPGSGPHAAGPHHDDVTGQQLDLLVPGALEIVGPDAIQAALEIVGPDAMAGRQVLSLDRSRNAPRPRGASRAR